MTNGLTCDTASVSVCPHHHPGAKGRVQTHRQKSQWLLLTSETPHAHVVVPLIDPMAVAH